MRPGRPALAIPHAVVLGLAQGPTELLPVSSSAHTTLIPLLAGWPYRELDAELRKSFEVALHAGAGAALAIDMRRELVRAAASLSARRALVVALSLAPATVIGYAFERQIEARLASPRQIALALAGGALAMALADARPARGGCRPERDAAPGDGLALGLAQALALIPGVSRNGAALTAARARGFARRDAHTLSWHAALPVILGAGALRGVRLARRPPARGRGALVAGAAGAFASTLVSARALRRRARGEGSLLPYSLYRLLLAALVLRSQRSSTASKPAPSIDR